MTKRWMGPLPTNCDICKKALVGGFVDGKTLFGPWGIMCVLSTPGSPSCFQKHGGRLGQGWGQKYNAAGEKVDG